MGLSRPTRSGKRTGPFEDISFARLVASIPRKSSSPKRISIEFEDFDIQRRINKHARAATIPKTPTTVALRRLREFRELLPIFPSLVWVFSLLCLVSRPFAIALNNNELTTFENIQELK